MMYNAIVTKYLGPTNYKGSRIKASNGRVSITIGYDHSLSGVDVHAKAAKALAVKHKWFGNYVAGAMGHGFVFIKHNPSPNPDFSVSE